MSKDPHATYTQINQGGKYGLADEKGKVIVPCIWNSIGSFVDGLAQVEDEAELWGFIDKTGACVLSNDSWCNVSSSHDGLALVEVWKEDEGFYFAYIDKTGTEVIKRPFDPPSNEHPSDEATVDSETGRIRFGEDYYSDARIVELVFSEQILIRVKGVNGLFGFMDRFGKIVIPCIWRHTGMFFGIVR